MTQPPPAPAPDRDGGPRARTASLATIAREWTWIGVTGFGGPPAHIALLRRLVVERERLARRARVRGRQRRLRPAARDRRRRSWRSSARTARAVRPARSSAGSGSSCRPSSMILALSPLFLAHAPPAWVRGAGAGAGAAVAAVAVQAARGLLGPSFARVRHDRARRARWVAYLAAGGRRRGADRPLPRARAARLRRSSRCCDPAPAAATPAVSAATLARVVQRGGTAVARVDRVQDRRARVRRRLRDHPADAGRRRPHLPLDDQRPVPERGRARPGHAGSGRRDRRRGRLRRARHRRAACSPPPSRSRRRSRSSCSAAAASSACARTRRARAFLDGAGPAAIGAILGAAVTLAERAPRGLAVRRCSAWPRSRCSWRAAASSRRCSAPGAIGVVVALAGGPLP